MVNLAPVSQPPEETCGECGGSLIQTFADVVCKRCGLVQRRNYVEPQFTILDQVEQEHSVAYVAPANRPNIVDDLRSFLGHYRAALLRDGKGQRLAPALQADWKRRKKVNDLGFHEAQDKRQYRGLRMLNALLGVLELSAATLDDAALLFRKTEADLEGQVYMAEMVAGAVYLAVRTNSEETLLLKELVKGCQNAGLNVRQAKILQAAAVIRRLTGRQLPVSTPSTYFEKIYHKLIHHPTVITILQEYGLEVPEYGQLLRTTTTQLLTQLLDHKRTSRNPYVLMCATFVGAGIHLARILRNRKTGLVSQKQIAQICGVAEYTLREHYLKLIKPLLPAGRG